MNFHELLRVPVKVSDQLKIGKLRFEIDLQNTITNVPVIDSFFCHCNGYLYIREKGDRKGGPHLCLTTPDQNLAMLSE